MFVELPKERYKEIIPLYDKSRFINAIRSHLEGTPIEKEVYVDNLENPQAAALVVGHRAFLGGDSSNTIYNIALRDFFIIKKREILESDDIYEVDFYFSSEDWIKTLTSSFPHSFPYPRYYYEIKELKMKNWRDKIPIGYTIEPVDLSLLENEHLENYDWLIDEIEENWLPFEEHLKTNRGFYIVYDQKEIVAWCTSEYLTKDKHVEVGIATRGEHRKQGLAKIVGSATVELCLSRYKTVGWHCNVHNVPSCKAAESIGFEKTKEYQKVGYFFNKLDNFILQGFNNFLVKNYDEAIHYYGLVFDAYTNGDEAIQTSAFLTKWGFTIDKLTMEYASFYAASGAQDECLEKIQEAIDMGYEDIESFEKEELFIILHSRPEWEHLKEVIKKNKGE